MCFRAYEPDRDFQAVCRTWAESGWLEGDDTKEIEAHLSCSRALVADVDGVAECLVMTNPGTIRYLDADLPLGIVTAVTTSRVARKCGFAGRLTARAIAADVADGAIVSALGMFEQGYYDRLGFGTGGYVHRIGCMPASLGVPGADRPPRRLTVDDHAAVHANRLTRHRAHGACSITPAEFTLSDILEHGPGGFGLGYFDGPDGSLSHHVWLDPRGKVEFGPYHVEWMAWQTPAQYRELLGLIKNLGDQVALVYMRETHGIQLQDLVDKPLRQRHVSRHSDFDAAMRVVAYWQVRMNDVAACLARTRLPVTEPVRFNTRLHDPIARPLEDAGVAWRGIGGEYVVTLGPESTAVPGVAAGLPTLDASAGAFSRLWLGVRPATALAMTDDLDGPPELLRQLDRTLRVPDPQPDWDF